MEVRRGAPACHQGAGNVAVVGSPLDLVGGKVHFEAVGITDLVVDEGLLREPVRGDSKGVGEARSPLPLASRPR